MTVQLHNTGEEFILDYTFTDGATRPSDISIGLYDDGTDSLTDSDDLASITTEPSGSAYARQTASFPGDFTNSAVSGDWETEIANQTFSSSNSTQTVDSYFTVVSFNSDDAGDSSTTDHIFFSGSLGSSTDLSGIDSLTVSASGLSLT